MTAWHPHEVIQKTLKMGKIFGMVNEQGICILKYRDKKEILLLSTNYTTETMEVQKRNEKVKKSYIDQSDQMSRFGIWDSLGPPKRNYISNTNTPKI